MRWLLILVLLLCLACGGNSGGGAAGDAGRVASKLLYVSNESQAPMGEVQLGIASVQRQLDQEFRAAYNVSATLVFADAPTAKDYVIHLQDSSHNGHIGYYQGHEAWVQATVDGAPLLGWTEILSHEAIEVLMGDICDPVVRPYSIPPGSPAVENFLLPGGRDYISTI